MNRTIQYPRKVEDKEVFNQKTLDALTASIMSWRQGPGIVGALQLHACWGNTSVLAKRYQGQTVSNYYYLLGGTMLLFDRTGNLKWKRFADDIASNILFLQCEDGGFRHAVAEFEPVYASTPTCPIHQNLPVLALLDYAAWKNADETIKSFIKPAIDKHWNWFNKFWLSGTKWQSPLKHGGGWCGVTNQDLVAVAALTAYGRLYSDFSRFEEYGKKALDAYFSPAYYHKEIGLFERGDGPNFTERTPYYHIILEMLERIYNDVADERIPEIIDNISLHLFDSVYTAPDGHVHLAWGAKTDSQDKSRVLGWNETPVVFGDYPPLIQSMESVLKRNPDIKKEEILKALKNSLASYVFADGGIPATLWPKEPILSVVVSANSDIINFWRCIIRYLGSDVADPQPVPVVGICRKIGELTWKEKGLLWAIEKNGNRVYGGYKPLSHGITHGVDEAPAYGDYNTLDECEITEIISG